MNKEKFFIFTVAIIGAVLLYNAKIDQNGDAFQLWKQKFGSSCTIQLGQQSFRKLIFYKNLKQIAQHNQNPNRAYDKGVNQFTIYTQHQFQQRFLSPIIPTSYDSVTIDIENIESNLNLKDNIDWTTKHAVTQVKMQGQCVAGWAFSATGVIESWSAITRQFAVQLSEQQLIDCSKYYGNNGCVSGNVQNAMHYIKSTGISTEEQYPYKGKLGSCAKRGGSFLITDYMISQSCAGIQTALMNQPLSVVVAAGTWLTYKSGVLAQCGSAINHYVLLVGIEAGVWKIKNSWGVFWGEEGYIRLAPGNTCGLCNYGGLYIQQN